MENTEFMESPTLAITRAELADFLREASADPGEGCAFTLIGTAFGMDWYAVVARDAEGEVRAKLARNCDDLQCDYDWDWEMPVNEATSEVLDSDIPVTPGSADSDAAWLMGGFAGIPDFMSPRAAEGGSL